VGTKYFSSTDRSDLGDDFCKSLFVLCLLAICCPSVFDLWILITSLVSSNSSYIWKVRNSSLRHRGLQQSLTLPWLATLVFLIPNFHILFTFDFKCTQWRLLQKHLYDVGFFFFVIVHFFLYRKNCWPSQFTCSFHYYHSHKIDE
jgi:hypothetical protein